MNMLRTGSIISKSSDTQIRITEGKGYFGNKDTLYYFPPMKINFPIYKKNVNIIIGFNKESNLIEQHEEKEPKQPPKDSNILWVGYIVFKDKKIETIYQYPGQ